MPANNDVKVAAVIAENHFAIEAVRSTVAYTERERERVRVAVEESRKLREQWRGRFRKQAERLGG